jgi:very-short-patch-repair endonuclease
MRWDVRAELRAGRWRRRGRQTIQVGEGNQQLAAWWTALFEVGGGSVLDGVSALVAGGMKIMEERTIDVAAPKSTRPRKARGVRVHETRRFEDASVIRVGVPRMKPATAAVHAVLWAKTDRQASAIVLTAAQQGLFSQAEFAEEVAKIRRNKRRALLRSLADDISGGVESLGEREFARLCRQRGFPKPSRQVRRTTSSGSWRYDNVWDRYRTTAEIDGSHHQQPEQAMRDALKENEMRLDGHVVVRIPNSALRTNPEPYLDQLEAALRRGGWAGRKPA